jgi:mannan endo-1,4-beta-mannosidase
MRKKILCMVLVVVMLMTTGCNTEKTETVENPTTLEQPSPMENPTPLEQPSPIENPTPSQNSTPTEEVEKEKMENIILQAEDAILHGKTVISTGRDDYTGTGYVTGFYEEEDGATFTVTVNQEGAFDLIFNANSNGDYKEMFVYVDGEKRGGIDMQNNGFKDSSLKKTWLKEGTHEITLKNGWGYIDLDALTVRQVDPVRDSVYSDVFAELANPNATQETKNLYNYLLSIYGEKTLLGQHPDKNGMFSSDMQAIKKETGKLPAFMELDFMDYSNSRKEHGDPGNTLVDQAIKFAEQGGIVGASWHWNAPSKYLYNTAEKPWFSGFYQDTSFIDIEKIMLGEDEEGYNLLLEDIDTVAAEIKKLQEKNIPLIFRPLHEGNGGWFWWGSKGAVAYKELYRMLYDRLTNYHGLNNIIWVWNCNDVEWYPGDNCVDIISVDTSAGAFQYSTQAHQFLKLYAAAGRRKMIAMSECGTMIDPERMVEENVHWLYYSCWVGTNSNTSSIINEYLELNTEKEMLHKIVESDVIVTLDKLPDWINGSFE